jgi:two-component system cell cycle response regulator
MLTKILTVDDSKTIRLIVSRAFKTFDSQILEAANGVEGLAVATREKPDLIILDFTMPIMDGYEMLTRLKSHPDLKNIPVIMLTAEAGRDNVMRIARMGVRDYLIKPFKEEQVVDRVSRIIDLKPRGESASKVKRFDDEITLLVVDDKPAILEQIRAGLQDTKWVVDGRTQSAQAIDYCSSHMPEVMLVSLSLPDNAAFNLFQMLRASVTTKNMPIFAMSVKTALEEQIQAQQVGFTGIITKPIDFDDLKARIARALNLDTSYKYYEIRSGVLMLTLPTTLNPVVLNEVQSHLRAKLVEAVDAGVDKLIVDLSQLAVADVSVIKLGLTTMQYCQELSVRQSLIGSDAVCKECKNYEETKDWRFVNSFEEGLIALNGKQLMAA